MSQQKDAKSKTAKMVNAKMKLQKAASIATDLPQCMQADKAGSQVRCIMGRNTCDPPLRTGVKLQGLFCMGAKNCFLVNVVICRNSLLIISLFSFTIWVKN